MKKIRILPRKETMIVIYPLVAAQYIIYHHENDLFMPTFVLIPITISMIIVLGMGFKLVMGKIVDLKKSINEREGR